jgi:VCBS repeat-containing protein
VTIITGTSGDDNLKGSKFDDAMYGGNGEDFLQGKAGNDYLDGGAADDVLHGDAGDDTLKGGAGNDLIHGGTGTDTAVYSGSILHYSFSRNGENLFVSHTGGTHADGNDRLLHVERLVFADAVIDLENNNAPIAFNDVASTDEDVGTYNGASVLANDFDWEGDSMSVTPGTFVGAYGTLVMNSNGTYTYTPHASTQALAAGQVVQDSFSYTVSDGSLSDTGTLTITVSGRNDAPVANPDAATGHENQVLTVNVLANDTDVDNGAVLTVVSASAPSGKGTASVVGNQVQFNPGTDFDHLAVGASEVVVINYTMTDEHGATSSSTVSVTVTGTNDGPVANPDSAAGNENQVLTIDALASDTDVDDGAVKTLVSIAAPPGKGSATIVGNQVQFDPGSDFDHLAAGATETVVLGYTMQDEHGASSSSTITVTVTGTNDGPVANPDSASTGENDVVAVNVLANDTDVDDGAVLTVVSASAPAGQGSASVVANQVEFNPGTDFDYLDTGETAQVVVSYTIEDEHGAQSGSSVTITVSGVNDAPVAVDDTAATDENSPVSGNVLTNDVDPDDSLTVANPGTFIGAYGTLVLAANGTYTYTPGAAAQALTNGQTANDVFNYIASDGTVSDAGSLTITISGLSGVPNANDDTAVTTEDASVSGNVLANDTDAENDPMTVSDPGTYVGTYGTLTLNSNGSYTYVPNSAADGLAVGETAQDVFTYTATDGTGSDTATLTVTVTGTNDAPTIDAGGTDASGSVTELPDGAPGEGTTVHTDSGTVAFDDIDLSDTHSASVTPQGAFYLGTFTLDPVDQPGDSVGWDFTVSDAALEGLSEGEIRIQTYTIEIDDGHGGTVTQDVTITITGAGVGAGPQTVWFIDNSAVGSANLGTSADPYTSIAAFNAAQGSLGGPQPGHTVHLRAGTGTGVYAEADGINLLNGQILVGDATGSVRPTIEALAGDGVNVAQNNNVSGIDIGDTSGADIADSGGSVGTLTISDVGSSGTGRIIDVDQGGTLNVTLNSATSTASTGGAIDLNAVGGSFTVTGATTITGALGGGVDVTSGVNLAVDFQGGLSASTGSTTAVNFQGNMGSSSLAINGLNLLTTTGTALNVTNGGTVEVTGSGNTVSTTGGTAVNIAFATIGAGEVTLDSVSSIGGTTAGINLNTAGSGFNVGGGNISGKVGAAGISINATSDIELTDMSIVGNSGGGIVGTSVSDFSLTNSTLTNNGSSASQGGIYFTGLTGDVDLLGNVIGGSSGDNVHIVQTGGSLDLQIGDNGSTQAIMGTVNNVTGNDSVLIQTTGSSTLLLEVDGVDFQGARGDLLQVVASDTSTQNLTISNNAFINAQNSTPGGGGVTLGGGGPGSNIAVTYDVVDNVFQGADGSALRAVYIPAAGTITGHIAGNIIGLNDGVAGTEGSSGGGDGIFVGLEKQAGGGTAVHTVTIEDNEIYDIVFGSGISLRSNGGEAPDEATLEATVTGNTVAELGEFAYAALSATVGGTAASGEYAELGLDLRDNILDATGSFVVAGVVLEQISSDAHFYFPDYSGSPDGELAGGTASTDLAAFFAANGNVITVPFSVEVDAFLVTNATGDQLAYPVWP